MQPRDNLASEIRASLNKLAEGLQRWRDGVMRQALNMAEARALHATGFDFSQWMKANNIPGTNDAHMALLYLGQNPEKARKALDNCEYPTPIEVVAAWAKTGK